MGTIQIVGDLPTFFQKGEAQCWEGKKDKKGKILKQFIT